MSRTLSASDRASLIRLASSLPVGDAKRKAILAGLSKAATEFNVPGKHILDNAQVYGSARVFGSATVSGSAQVFDTAKVGGNAVVSGVAQIGGTAVILGGEWDGSEGEILSGRWRAPGVPA